jgi:NlpC/P60 family putative phage cell wall peptidase
MNTFVIAPIGERIVTEAIEWIGTPWHHGQSKKGIGCDCVGFLAGVGVSVGFLSPDFTLENYERIPRNNFLVKSLDRYLVRVEGKPDIGDVLVFKRAGVITHVGIYAGKEVYLHADTKKGVICSYLADVIRTLVLIYRVKY